MKVQELLEAIDNKNFEAIVITPDYDDFATTMNGIPNFYENISQSSYELYTKIKDYEVANIIGYTVDEINHKCWLVINCKGEYQ